MSGLAALLQKVCMMRIVLSSSVRLWLNIYANLMLFAEMPKRFAAFIVVYSWDVLVS